MAQLSADDRKKTQTLLSIFERRDPDGTYHFSDGEVRHFVPLLVLVSGEALGDEMSVELRTLMGEFAQAAGLSAKSTAKQVQAAVDAHYAKFPVNPELLAAFKSVVREGALSGDAGRAAGESFAKFLGGRPKTTAPAAKAPAAGELNPLMLRLRGAQTSKPPAKTTHAKGGRGPAKKRP